jgi:hypothetical protein
MMFLVAKATPLKNSTNRTAKHRTKPDKHQAKSRFKSTNKQTSDQQAKNPKNSENRN